MYKKKYNSFLNFINLTGEPFLNNLLEIYGFLKFDLPASHSLNFPKISRPFLAGPTAFRLTSVVFAGIFHVTRSKFVPSLQLITILTFDVY